MKQLTILFAIILASIAGYSQDVKKVIADETTLTDMKSSIKIECSNEAITAKILKDLKGKLKSYSVKFKTDRQGRFEVTTFYFATADKAVITGTISKY